jgi:hypothetical protein
MDKKPCIVTISTDDTWHFTVINKNVSIPVTFLAVDKCLFQDNISCCDFIVFNQKEFCFIEINDTESRRSPRYAKSTGQLEKTIISFAPVNFTGYVLEAFISFRNKPVRPTASTTFQNASIRFWDKYQVNLYDTNEKVFG